MKVVVDNTADDGPAEPDLRLVGVRALGFAGEMMFVQSLHSGEIHGWPASKFTEAGLLTLAPRRLWVEHFGETNRGRLKTDIIQDAIFDACRQGGPVDLADIRGRGAWLDRLDEEDVVVFNGGPSVIALGKEWPQGEAPLARAYAVGPPLMRLGKTLEPIDRLAVLDLCEALMWRERRSARLFAGLLAIAPICGALDWRPHAWLRAPAGSGKSWILNHVVAKVLGEGPLYLTGNVTEPGFRRILGRDARFVVVDEAEAASEDDARRLRAILQHARHLSTDSMSVAARAGAQGGGVERFLGRGSILFASVATPRFDEADAGRFTIFELAAPHRAPADELAAAREASAQLVAGLPAGYAGAFLASALEAAPIIRANHEVFARAIAQRVGDRRLGDQEGAMLAGAEFLEGVDRVLSIDEAARRLDALEWSCGPPAAEPDHAVCLAAVLSTQIPFDVREGRGRQTLSLARAVQVAAGEASEPDLNSRDIARTLRELGVRVESPEGGRRGPSARDGAVYLANGSDLVRRALERTPFAQGWSDVLRQRPGALVAAHPVRFAGSVKQRATILPIADFLEGDGS